MRHTALVILLALLAGACEREDRHFRPPASALAPVVPQTSLRAGPAIAPPHFDSDYQANAHAMAEGKRLFRWFNCNGCHANGGGGSGPALMDDKWIYGAAPEQIYATIVGGRPNGMPAFGARIPEQQVWQLVAYVRSLSGLGPSDAEPGRSDALQSKRPEHRKEPETPKQVGKPG